MTLTSKITCDDIRKKLNGTVTGSTYTFWDQDYTSGSLQSQVDDSTNYLYNVLGRTLMEDTTEITDAIITTAQLAYASFLTIVSLSGGVVTEGFNWEAGVKVENPKMLEAYKNIADAFKESYNRIIAQIQPMVFSDETDQPTYHDTATSPM